MISEKIKQIRVSRGMTQAEVAKKLGISRSGVNAWEMGITVPSTQYIIALSQLFNVSSDYLLNIKTTSGIDITGLSEKEVAAVLQIIECIKNRKNTQE